MEPKSLIPSKTSDNIYERRDVCVALRDKLGPLFRYIDKDGGFTPQAIENIVAGFHLVKEEGLVQVARLLEAQIFVRRLDDNLRNLSSGRTKYSTSKALYDVPRSFMCRWPRPAPSYWEQMFNICVMLTRFLVRWPEPGDVNVWKPRDCVTPNADMWELLMSGQFVADCRVWAQLMVWLMCHVGGKRPDFAWGSFVTEGIQMEICIGSVSFPPDIARKIPTAWHDIIEDFSQYVLILGNGAGCDVYSWHPDRVELTHGSDVGNATNNVRLCAFLSARHGLQFLKELSAAKSTPECLTAVSTLAAAMSLYSLWPHFYVIEDEGKFKRVEAEAFTPR